MIYPGADVAPGVIVPDSARVWGFAQLRSGVILGNEVVVGRGAYVGTGVQVGARTKIQNYALVYEPAVLEAGVFIGPAAVLTNDRNPRAVNPDGTLKTASDWEPVGVVVREGASVGASATCIGPLVIGRWAMVAAGSVVSRDVPDFALVAGVPARQAGWVSRAGHRLVPDGPGAWRCLVSGEQYRENGVGSAGALLELA